MAETIIKYNRVKENKKDVSNILYNSSLINSAIANNTNTNNGVVDDSLWKESIGNNALIPKESLNIAEGVNSIAIGTETLTYNEGELSLGVFNLPSSGETLFTIGDGTDDVNRHNIFAVGKQYSTFNNQVKFNSSLSGYSANFSNSLTSPIISGLSGTFADSVSTSSISGDSAILSSGLTAPTISGTNGTFSTRVKANNVSGKTGTFTTSIKAPTISGQTGTLNTLTVNDKITTDKIQAVSGYIQTLLSEDITVDNLTVTKAAHFFKLIIDEIKATQGQVIITPANAVIDKVETVNNNYRCYFRCKQDTKEISNTFEVNDQVVCQTFNAATGVSYNVSNTYYWRLCVDTGTTSTTINGESVDCHYIDLSNSDKDSYSNSAPKEGDNVVQLGNRSDSTRQAAIIISAYNTQFLDKNVKAPSIVQYYGINDYNLENHRRNVISRDFNEFTGTFKTSNGNDIEDLIDDVTSGATAYLHTAWANSADGSSGFTKTPNGGSYSYIGFCSNNNESDTNLVYTDYTWSYVKGSKGDNGNDGASGYTPYIQNDYWYINGVNTGVKAAGKDGLNGSNGVDGASGTSSYFHVAYCNKTTAGTITDFSTSDPTNRDYIGTYVDSTVADSTNPNSYSWQLVKGAQGERGEQGISGTSGTNGKTSYLHIKYSNDGGSSFTSNNGEDVGKYLGQYVDFKSADSTNVTAYTWALIKGEDGTNGTNGNDGISITGVTEYYLISSASSNVTTATTGWGTTVVSPTAAKKYLWNYEQIKYSNNTSTKTTPIIIGNYAKDGTNGTNGNDGRGISAITEYYRTYTANTGITTASTGWNTAIPTMDSTNKYLWNYELISYTDGTTAKTQAVVIGVYGDKGDKGDSGTSVSVTSTSVTYAKTTATTQPSDNSISSTTIPSLSSGDYLWCKTIVSYSNGTSTKSYSVSRIGADGSNGVNGTNGVNGKDSYLHIAYALSSNGSSGFSTTYFNGALYIGTCTNNTQADPTTYSSYTWARLKGEQGIQGVSGVSVTISSTSVTYAVTTTATQPNDSSFTYTSIPSISKGNYLWTKTVVTYSDGKSTKTYTVSYQGADGSNGTNGVNGSNGKDAQFYKLVPTVEKAIVDKNGTLGVQLQYQIAHVSGSSVSTVTANTSGYWIRFKRNDNNTYYNLSTGTTSPSYTNNSFLANYHTQTSKPIYLSVYLVSGSSATIVEQTVVSVIFDAAATLEITDSITSTVQGHTNSISGLSNSISQINQKADSISATVTTQTATINNHTDLLNQIDMVKKVTVDATSLDESKAYPVSIKFTSSFAPTEVIKCCVRRGLNSAYGVPSYSTHANGFVLNLEWETKACGWGVNAVNRRWSTSDTTRYISNFEKSRLTDSSEKVVGSIGQATEISTEIVYVRGGSKYDVLTSWENADITLNTTGYSWQSGNYSDSRPIINVTDIVEPIQDTVTKNQITQATLAITDSIQATVSSHTTSINNISGTVGSHTTNINNLQNQLDNIEIGSYNILRYTATPKYYNSNDTTIDSRDGTWTKASDGNSTANTREIFDISNPPVSGIKKGIRVIKNDSNTVHARYNNGEIVSGETYTLSCYAMATSGTPQLMLEWGNSTIGYRTKTVDITSDWKQYSYTFTASATTNNCWLYVGAANVTGTMEICGMMLENGNVCTCWKPNPNDYEATVNNQITTISNSVSNISQKADSISATVSTHTTQINSANGNISTLQNDVSNLKQTASSITTTVSSHTTSINSLSGTVTGHTSQINTATGNITTLQSDVSNLKQTASGISATVSSHTTTITNHTNNINSLSGTVTTHTNQLSNVEFKKKVTVDATSLDSSKAYPVSIKFNYSTTFPQPKVIHCQVIRNLLTSYGAPSYASHNQGFSVNVEWDTKASGWGANTVNKNWSTSDTTRFINSFMKSWLNTDEKVVGSIGQCTEDSTEIVYVRGGSKYDILTTHENSTITLNSSGFSWQSGNYSDSRPIINATAIVEPIQDTVTKNEITQATLAITDSINATVSSHTTSINSLNNTVTSHTSSIGQLELTANSMRSSITTINGKLEHKNYFSFNRGIKPYSTSCLLYPYGYGFVGWGSTDRIINFGFTDADLDEDWTLVFEIKASSQVTVTPKFCGVSSDAIYKYTTEQTNATSLTATTSWVTYRVMWYEINNSYLTDTTYNGYLNFAKSNNSTTIYLRNIALVKGQYPALQFEKGEEDLNYQGGLQPFKWNLNNLQTAGTFRGLPIYQNTVKPNSTTTSYDYIFYNGYTIKDKTPYTLSFWAKADRTGVKIEHYFYNGSWNLHYNASGVDNNGSDGFWVTPLTTDWQHYTVHWYSHIYSTNGTSGQEYIKNILPFRLYKDRASANSAATVSIAGVVFQEGWVDDSSSSNSSLIQQTSDNILMSVGSCGINIDEQTITLNGDTNVNGTLTLTDENQGFILAGDGGRTQITPQSIGSYAAFTGNSTNDLNIYKSYSQYLPVASDGATATTATWSTINEFGIVPSSTYIPLTAQTSTFRKGISTVTPISITNTYKIYVDNSLVSTITNSTQTVSNIGSYTTTAKGALRIDRITTATFRTSDLNGDNGTYYVSGTLTYHVQIPKEKFSLLGYDGFACNFGTNSNVYFGSSGAWLRYGNYGISITSSGLRKYNGSSFVPLNRLNVVRTSASSYTIGADDDLIVTTSSSSQSIIFPYPSSYTGRVIYVKCNGSSGPNIYCNSTNNSTAYFLRPGAGTTKDVYFNLGGNTEMFISDGYSWIRGYMG